VVGNVDAAEDQLSAFDEGMDIISDTDADHGWRVAGGGTGVTNEGAKGVWLASMACAEGRGGVRWGVLCNEPPLPCFYAPS
jgi:hypothetical protein